MLYLKNIIKNIFTRHLLLILLLSSCSLPLFPGKAPDVTTLLQAPPLAGNNFFTMYHLPPEFDIQRILAELTATAQTVQQYLHLPVANPVPVVIFSSDGPSGKHYLRKSGTRHMAVGHYNAQDRILIVIGQDSDSRFHTVLRHEAVHAVLPSSGKRCLPFWFDEGLASFFEQDGRGKHDPDIYNERLARIQYHLQNGGKLNLAGLINNPYEKKSSGIAYARSWGVVACLYKEQRNISGYLLTLEDESDHPGKEFSQSLLRPGESIDTFDKNCSDWLLSL